MDEQKSNFWATADELRLNDVVQCPGMASAPFNTAIVKQIEFLMVILFRPYGHGAGFSMSGHQQICYTGFESVKLWKDSKEKIWVFERRGLPTDDKLEQASAIAAHRSELSTIK